MLEGWNGEIQLAAGSPPVRSKIQDAGYRGRTTENNFELRIGDLGRHGKRLFL